MSSVYLTWLMFKIILLLLLFLEYSLSLRLEMLWNKNVDFMSIVLDLKLS